MLDTTSASRDTRERHPTFRIRNVLAALLVGCTTFLFACASTPPTTGAAGVKTMRVNGYDLAYAERGSGVPVVLVHGSLSDYRSWADQMEPLGTRYRVIALSLRHFYPERWDGKGDDFSIEQHTRDVASFIKGLNSGRVHLIAHSRGGNVGLHVAKQHPELLRSLVLADASGLEVLLPKSPSGQSDAASGASARKKLQQRLLAGEADLGLAEFIDFTTGPGAWAASTEETRQVWRDNAWTIIGDVGRPQTTCAEGAEITMPTLLINGEVSPLRYRQMFDAFQTCLKVRERVSIPKASHRMFRTHSEVTNAAVLKFLDRN